MNWIKQFLASWASQTKYKEPIALHLARVSLYDLKKEDALYPVVRDKCIALQARMKELGMPIWIPDTFRSVPKQLALSSGVTKAGELQSYHQYGLAFDVAFKVHNWNPPARYWTILLYEAEVLGLEGIGSWDPGHFEFHEGFTWRDLIDYFKING